MKNGLSPQYMREHILNMVYIPITLDSAAKGHLLFQRLNHMVFLNHSATTGVHYGTH